MQPDESADLPTPPAEPATGTQEGIPLASLESSVAGSGKTARTVDPDDPELGYSTEMIGADATVVAFGGVSHKLAGLAPFEFFTMLGSTPVNKVFVRDLDQAWYQKGVRGLSRDVTGTADALGTLVQNEGSPRIVTIGASAGGFAAILFGSLIGADHVVAFGPQTFIDRERRRACGDKRWPRLIGRIYSDVAPDAQVLGVADAIENAPDTQIEIHHGRRDRIDSVHAAAVSHLPNVIVEDHAAGHNVARILREEGRLEPILERALGLRG